LRLLLIVPRAPGGGGGLTPNLGIVALAALTPRDIEVSVIDENIEKINFDEEVDLVGITAMTPRQHSGRTRSPLPSKRKREPLFWEGFMLRRCPKKPFNMPIL